MNKNNRILGGLFGVACGDALGGTLEFMSKYEIEREYGYLKDIIGGGCWDLEPGEVTDDTMMTIAVAEGILDNPDNPVEDIGKHFIKWYDSRPKDIGNIIRIALGEYKRSKDWTKAALYAHEATGGMSAGNGSLMRCLPVALYYDDIEKMLEITTSQSLLTHYDQKATDACQFYNLLAYHYLNYEKSKIAAIIEYIEQYPEYKQVFHLSKKELMPTGYVVDTLICALWCFINTSSFEDAVCEAANLGGDTDTIAAITGGLAGVFYGHEAIPAGWKEKILVRERLYSIAEKIIEVKNEGKDKEE
ncbi:MAG TPA: ADP-ribosyl-[dinitrogen reductase] hydrolase [Clostridiaceae bacterium]|nr:ADP-ribosyl-[dinitrogen reductase] hydrolase [Clostridiaceae bacterium]